MLLRVCYSLHDVAAAVDVFVVGGGGVPARLKAVSEKKNKVNSRCIEISLWNALGEGLMWLMWLMCHAGNSDNTAKSQFNIFYRRKKKEVKTQEWWHKNDKYSFSPVRFNHLWMVAGIWFYSRAPATSKPPSRNIHSKKEKKASKPAHCGFLNIYINVYLSIFYY